MTDNMVSPIAFARGNPDNVGEVVAASRREPPYEISSKVCENCGGYIYVTAFKGEPFCSIDCKKALGLDVSSVGTFMFVTHEEKRSIESGRREGKPLVVRNA